MKKKKKTPRTTAATPAPVMPAAPSSMAFHRWWLTVGLLVLAGLCAHLSGLKGHFLLDDEFNLEKNETIRALGNWHGIWHPNAESFGVSGRPVLNFSFALNYALGGLTPLGYHWFNLGLHLAAMLMLWGTVRRTLAQPLWPEGIRAAAEPLAFAVALLWGVHPLQTNTVTYISQRAELLMGVFYLLALYGLVRHATAPGRWRWPLLSVVSALLGILTKEPIMTAPVLLFLFDWAFLAGTAGEAWRRRWPLYLGLASIWLVMAANLHLATHSAGFDSGVSGWHYLLTESFALCRYVGVMFWPPAMVFDYGQNFARHFGEVWPWFLLVSATLAGSVWLWWRHPRLGFAPLAFFILLAPTSSIIPLAKMPYAESRLYLPLAVVCAGVVITLGARLSRRWLITGLLVLTPVLIGSTIARNRLFSDTIALWRADLRWCPDNHRIWNNLGTCYLDRADPAEAEKCFREAVRLLPNFGTAVNNIGVSLERQGQLEEGEKYYRAAVKLAPFYINGRANLARTLMRKQQWNEAHRQYEQLLLLKPKSAVYHTDLGVICESLGRVDEAETHYQAAVTFDPGFAPAHNNIGSLRFNAGRFAEAAREYQLATVADPTNAGIWTNYGHALKALGREAEAAQAYQRSTALGGTPN